MQIFTNDPYLVDINAIIRLEKEYKKHNSLIIAVDLDGTINDFHGENFKFPKIINLLRTAKEFNCYIFIFTAHPDEEFVYSYCKENNIPFDAINDSPVKENMNIKKPYYNILLDDRAGLPAAYKQLKYLFKILSAEKL